MAQPMSKMRTVLGMSAEASTSDRRPIPSVVSRARPKITPMANHQGVCNQVARDRCHARQHGKDGQSSYEPWVICQINGPYKATVTPA